MYKPESKSIQLDQPVKKQHNYLPKYKNLQETSELRSVMKNIYDLAYLFMTGKKDIL